MGKSTYEQDFFGWTREQASLLRSGRLSQLDVEHLIEEIEGMGRSERRQLTHRLELLLMHLLKWEHQESRREIDGKSWLRTIREQRRRIPRLLRDNPSLQPLLAECIQDAYEDARFGASDGTGLPISAFPEACPYPAERVLEPEFLPD